MSEILHARRIFIDGEDQKERITEISILFEDILDCHGSKGCGLPFKNREPKTHVTLNGDRGMWLLIPLSRFRKMWEAYTHGEASWDFAFSCN